MQRPCATHNRQAIIIKGQTHLKPIALLAVIYTSLLSAQVSNSWDSLRFLEGTWEARTQSASSGANATGTYTFRKELAVHIRARHTSATGCTGPADFNCEHGDLLYVYQDAPGQPL